MRRNQLKALQEILDSARQAGIELNENEAAEWLLTISSLKYDSTAVDRQHGIFGQRIALLDFDPQDLGYFREIGAIVEIPDRENVETALALSGSAAQSKIQTHPGDCDFFERVNIKAATHVAACRLLSDVIREKALDTIGGKIYRLLVVRFGSYPFACKHNGEEMKKGASIVWKPDEIVAGKIVVEDPDGNSIPLTWGKVSMEPGWCKMDWVVADLVHLQLANASNNLDVTWEDPDGRIVPLDGQVDPYFQEVYLDVESIPLFTKLAKSVAADAIDDYVDRLRYEIRKYLNDPNKNFGKAAKRMYNIFRLTGRYAEAAYLRELFDEPATIIYQVSALVRTVEEASQHGSQISESTINAQVDALILNAVNVLEGEREVRVVEKLIAMRDILNQHNNQILDEHVDAIQNELLEEINSYFYERLVNLPAIQEYILSLQE